MTNSKPHIIDDKLKSILLDCYDISCEYEEDSHEAKSSLLTELESSNEKFSDIAFHAKGGMKRICKVKDNHAGRYIAMAELKNQNSSSQNAIERFLREARITAALEHPNIVPIYEIGINQRGKPFFTMKFLKDQNLKKIIRELIKANPVYLSKYPLNTILNIFQKICEAVAYAHSQNVVHLDLKPENIMIGDYGEVYVCDWGLAKVTTDNSEAPILNSELLNDMTLSGVVRGTPGYMPPEQIDSKLSPRNERSDIYALGAILYNLLTYKRPFDGMTTEEVLKNTLKGRVPAPITIKDTIPESLNAVVYKAMAPKQENRYQTVKELIRDVDAFQEGFATDAEEVSFLKALKLLIKRNKRLLYTLVSILVTILFFILIMNHKESEALGTLTHHSQKYKQKVDKLQAKMHLYEKELKRLKENSTADKKVLMDSLRKVDSEKSFLMSQYKPLTISLNMTAGGAGITTTKNKKAGVIKCGYWENVYMNSSRGTTDISNLKDSNGNATGVGYTFKSTGKVKALSGIPSDPRIINQVMMLNSLVIYDTASFMFTGLNNFASTYYILIYSAQGGKKTKLQVSIDGESYFISNRHPPEDAFQRSLDNSEELFRNSKISSNHARFISLKKDSITIELKAIDGAAPVCGIQIVQSAPPEKTQDKKK